MRECGCGCVRVCVCTHECVWLCVRGAQRIPRLRPTAHPLDHNCAPSSHSLVDPDLMNDDINSVQAFLQKHNNTVGKWLKDSGYHTSFLGKVQFPALSCILCVLERVECVDTCMYIFAPPDVTKRLLCAYTIIHTVDSTLSAVRQQLRGSRSVGVVALGRIHTDV